MQLFVVTVSALVLLWGAVAYAVVAAATAYAGARSRFFAAAAALVASASVALVLARVPRNGEVVLPPLTSGHRVACTGRPRDAASVARGYVDQLRVEPEGAPLADGMVLESNRVIVASGWATDAATQHPVAEVCAAIDGALVPRESAAYGVPRPDVGVVFKNSAVDASGFELRVPLAAVAPGEHTLALVGIDGSGRDQALAPPRRFVIPPP